jgi:hypothetical protein
MAIREVLLSNTFEQQRQLINLIGTDVGDCDTLVTPSKVVSTSINQVVAGAVTLSGQTIRMEDGTSSSPSFSFDSATDLGLYKYNATTVGVSKNLYVGGDLTVDGNITFKAGNGTGGTISFGDLDTDNIVFNADLNSNIIPNTDNTFDLGKAGQEWRNLYLTGSAFIDTLQVDENATITGSLSLNSGLLTTTSGIVSLFNNTATTVNAFGDATSLNIGATGGTVVLRAQTITGATTVQNLYNTVATTVNAFGSAQQISMGVASASGQTNTNFTVRNDDFILLGKLTVNGAEILSVSNTFNFLVNNSDIRIGSVGGVGTTIINNSLQVKGSTINLTNQGVVVSLKDNINPALSIKEGSNTYLDFQTTDLSEKIIAYKDVSFLQNGYFGSGSNNKLYFGSANQFWIYNDTDDYIRGGNSNLRITGGNSILLQSHSGGADDETLAKFFSGGANELYFNGSKKFETTADGITVTGNITASGLTLSGDLIVNGTTTTINSATLSIDDLNIILADGASTSVAANGAGITLGTTGIGFNYSDTGTRWNSTENLNIATGKTYQINGTTVLSATAVLGRTPGGATAGDLVTIDASQTLTNKTLTTPAINGSTVGNASSTTDADATVDASTTSLYAYVQSATSTTRTINISNLTSGRMIELYLRNTNAVAKVINIAASTTTTGFAGVNLSKGDAGGTSQTSITLAATSGTAVVIVFNANGVIGGSIS